MKRAEIRTVTLPRKGSGGQQWKMVIEIKVENFRRLITLRSAVQVFRINRIIKSI